jgi:hypothetical protein
VSYPSLEQYQEALQHPSTVLTDPQLKRGSIATSGLGLPMVVSGGFALTYAVEVGSVKYAVRCFHREAKELERRYAAISRKLKSLASPYFVDFEYQPAGVRLGGSTYPLVKMAWAAGETLGEFVETNYRDKGKLSNLLSALTQLSTYLEQQGIAHGDIQEGNLMVSDGGKRVQLIDYDGMFVPEIAALGSSEMGHRDYQHPKRDGRIFDATLDRFSFMAVNVAIRALCEKPSVWSTTSSGAGVLVLRANDYADPGASKILGELASSSSLGRDARNFAAVCRATYRQVPSFAEFLAGKNIPQEIIVFDPKRSAEAPTPAYISQYPVLDAADYAAFQRHIGQMVELVGKVVEVRRDTGRFGRGKGKPYVFVNFAHWTGLCVKINLWSDALARGGQTPNESWVGRWVTLTGLVEPVYRSKKYSYQHIAISAASAAHITQLTEAEARYRLKGRSPIQTASNNASLLAQLGSKPQAAASRTPMAPSGSGGAGQLTPNQQRLVQMQQQTQSRATSHGGASTPSPQQAQSSSWATKYTPVPPPPKKGFERVPWWVWALCLFLIYLLFKH